MKSSRRAALVSGKPRFIGVRPARSFEVAAVLGEIEKPHFAYPYGALIARKGDEHEAAFLASLRRRP